MAYYVDFRDYEIQRLQNEIKSLREILYNINPGLLFTHDANIIMPSAFIPHTMPVEQSTTNQGYNATAATFFPSEGGNQG